MLLKELNLIGFGKFKNKSIILEEGINLIYGENEAGKSTLHSFIDGMFYGFLRPNVKSTLYLEEYEKYKPWDKSKYAGIIRIEHNGKVYRIERNFTKGEESTKVLDETTGVDITKDIDVGVGRILQPGIHFFGFNTRVFSNTISIKQLGSKIDDKLANEVTEKLINVTTSFDDDISVDNVVSELKTRMMEIGTDRATTKPYAKAIKDIEKLQEEKRKILREKDDYNIYLNEKARLSNALNMEMEILNSLKEELLVVQMLEKVRTLEESKILSDEIANLKMKIEKLLPYANMSLVQYEECINLNNSIDFIDRGIAEYKLELESIQNKLNDIGNIEYNDYHKEKLEEVGIDYINYEEMEEEKNKIIYNKEDNKIEFLKRDYKDFDNKLFRYKIISPAMIILSIVILIIGITLEKYILFSSLILPIGLLVCFFIKTKEIKLGMDNIKTQIDTIYIREKERQIRIEEIEKSKKTILEKYNIVNKLEFKRLLDSLQIEFYGKNKQTELYDELDNRQNSIKDKIFESEFNKKERLDKIKEIFDENNVKDINEFSQGLDKRTLLENNIKELEGKQAVLQKVLGQNTIEELIVEVDKFNLDIYNSDRNMDKNQIMYKIDKSNENIVDLKIALKGVEENLNILGMKIEKLVEIEEELDRKMKYKEFLENKYSSLELAAKTIEELSKDIHSQFAPTINEKVSKVVQKITGGKYNNIKISESLNISVENPITKEIIKLNSLSGGTIEQLYFSLRFGIINSMVSDKLPLILDDCFTQYDDMRLENIINFLVDICKGRQIILFTCHNRERKILDNLGVNFNLINLS
ncbi:AAA domain-containing protein [Tissierella praeacuta]|uniref:ATP-binding protein n=1 Tax=Tissierella praeacuta TaxID=43131 RepID=UPI0010460725|nr:AAA family ATPase [Tissierella praeacuta]TCU74033.1 AAA domain-containing protein [Tissierella praeacuta]